MTDSRKCHCCQVPLGQDDTAECPVCGARLTQPLPPKKQGSQIRSDPLSPHVPQETGTDRQSESRVGGTPPVIRGGEQTLVSEPRPAPFGPMPTDGSQTSSRGERTAVKDFARGPDSVSKPPCSLERPVRPPPFGAPAIAALRSTTTTENELSLVASDDIMMQPSASPSKPPRTDSRTACGGSCEIQSVDHLPSVKIRANWPVDQKSLPHFLLRGRGSQLEQVVAHFVFAVEHSARKSVSVAVAGESANVPDVNRPLRIVNTMQPGHRAATDVTFRAEGSDLYVRFEGRPRTLITYLRHAFFAVAYLVCFLVPFFVYLFGSGAFEGWLMDFSQKHGAHIHPGNPNGGAVLYQKLLHGYVVMDAEKFRNEFQRAKGDERLDEIIQGITLATGMGGITISGDPANWAGNDEALFAMWSDVLDLETVRELLVYSRADAFSVLASMGVKQHFKPDTYFVKEDPERRIFAGGSQMGPVNAVRRIEFIPQPDTDGLGSYMGADESSKLGKIISEALDKTLTPVRPINAIELFLADPKVCAWNIGIPVSIIAGLAGCGVWLIPKTLLRYPCRWAGWPTPDEFGNLVQGHNAWTERVLSDMLLHDFEVQEGDKFAITKR